jgi:glyoxylase-like metal-dependent hydrolase (beta-lactamase superfamily II)
MKTCETITDGVFRIKGTRSNIYLVAGRSLLLIDTGMPGDHVHIVNALTEAGYSPEMVSHVFITHAHLDHAGSLAAVQAATGAHIVASMFEQDHLEGRKMLCSMPREGPGGKLFKVILFFMEKYVQRYAPVRVDKPCGGTSGVVEAEGLEIVETPGHSPGSLCFYHREKRLLFTGDALSGAPALRLPLRAGCSDYRRALASVNRIAELDVEAYLFGHGEPLRAGAGSRLRELLALHE